MSSPPASQDAFFGHELRIPKERIAVLVGTNGAMKRKIQRHTASSITVDSKEGDIFITGTDMVKLYTAQQIVRAIGRGFNPETALLLLRADYALEQISLNEYSHHKNQQMRMKARVIGTKGKTRSIIEQTCEAYVSIYGKTIAIIGEVQRAHIAIRAIEMLLEGSPHAGVYKWLDQKRKTLMRQELTPYDITQDVKEEFKQYVDE